MIRDLRQALTLIAFTAALLYLVALFILEAEGSKAIRTRRQRLLRAAPLLALLAAIAALIYA